MTTKFWEKMILQFSLRVMKNTQIGMNKELREKVVILSDLRAT